MVSRKIYEIVGFLCGFVLIDYGYDLLAVGLPGTRQVASQFLGINLVLAGSGIAFTSLYYWLKPVAKATPSAPQQSAEGVIADKNRELAGFYKNVEYPDTSS